MLTNTTIEGLRTLHLHAMALGVAAWFNKISWGWAVAGIVGIALVFGAPQIVTWVRGMFGV